MYNVNHAYMYVYIHVYTLYISAKCHVHVCVYTCMCIHVHVYSDPSGPPTNLMLLASGPSTLFVSWSAPAINPEVVLEYVIRRTRQNNVSDVRETTRIDTNDAVTLRNLIPNTVYICEVFTRSRFGDSPAATDSARTPPRESKLLYMYIQHIHTYITHVHVDVTVDISNGDQCKQ